MSDDGSRRFTIADVLILVAGVALGLGLVRAIAPDLTLRGVWEAIANPREGWSVWYAFVFTLDFGSLLVSPFVAGWTPACLLLQVVGPRPPWRRLRRRPGFIACLIATITIAAGFIAVAVYSGSSLGAGREPPARYLIVLIPGSILGGCGVLWGWATMRLCGACRPSPTWRDRLGCFTGALWVVMGAIGIAYCFVTLNN